MTLEIKVYLAVLHDLIPPWDFSEEDPVMSNTWPIHRRLGTDMVHLLYSSLTSVTSISRMRWQIWC